MTVRKMTVLIPMSLEMLIDAGMASPEQVAEYEAAEARRKAEHRVLPLRRRLSIWWAVKRWSFRRSLHHRLFADFEREDD